jgi:hypothetical protein
MFLGVAPSTVPVLTTRAGDRREPGASAQQLVAACTSMPAGTRWTNSFKYELFSQDRPPRGSW